MPSRLSSSLIMPSKNSKKVRKKQETVRIHIHSSNGNESAEKSRMASRTALNDDADDEMEVTGSRNDVCLLGSEEGKLLHPEFLSENGPRASGTKDSGKEAGLEGGCQMGLNAASAASGRWVSAEQLGILTADCSGDMEDANPLEVKESEITKWPSVNEVFGVKNNQGRNQARLETRLKKPIETEPVAIGLNQAASSNRGSEKEKEKEKITAKLDGVGEHQFQNVSGDFCRREAAENLQGIKCFGGKSNEEEKESDLGKGWSNLQQSKKPHCEEHVRHLNENNSTCMRGPPKLSIPVFKGLNQNTQVETEWKQNTQVGTEWKQNAQVERGNSVGNEQFSSYQHAKTKELSRNAKTKWKDIVAGEGSTKGRTSLSYYAPTKVGNDILITPPMEVEQKGIDKWKKCVVGYFLGRKLPFLLTQRLAWSKWRLRGLTKILSNSNGYILFVFNEGADVELIVEEGFTHFANHLMILQKWDIDMELDKKPPECVPIWAHLSNVPLQLWHAEGLSYIASAIGKPLYSDNITEECDRLKFAKVCIEISPESELPWEIKVKNGNGKVTIVKVHYPWKPPKCPSCKSFGHSSFQCPKAPKHKEQGELKKENKTWVRKNNKEEEANRRRSNSMKDPEAHNQNIKESDAKVQQNINRSEHAVNESVGETASQSDVKRGRIKEKCVVNLEQDINGLISSNRFESLYDDEESGEEVNEGSLSTSANNSEKEREPSNAKEDGGGGLRPPLH